MSDLSLITRTKSSRPRRLFALTESVLPSPVAAQNLKFLIDEALACRRTKKPRQTYVDMVYST